MLEITLEQNREFEDRGRRWAGCMLNRLQQRWLDIPLLWPGTHEQAATIVHALTDESLTLLDREQLIEVIQKGARGAWRNITATPRPEEPQAAARS